MPCRYLQVWYCPVFSRVHPGCQVASCCVMLSRFCVIELVSIHEALWWPMYGWCTGMCYSVVFKCVFYLVLVLCTINFNFSLSICTLWSILVNTCHSYGSFCYVVTIRAAPYCTVELLLCFSRWGEVLCWGGFTVWPYLRG
jgi:hypothetical protein